jgi:hypothetical protein
VNTRRPQILLRAFSLVGHSGCNAVKVGLESLESFFHGDVGLIAEIADGSSDAVCV